ncbi:Restriction of telomere capping protein 5 [Didymosphaeria variabile]|uniref:Restriction of telomere capping protein 5 n=1 Tax=Didymosphaeria variabile TaxID=1932322 RepID=A0A9W8XSX9_9PLEO|nr:Restriction of telomere capping protein 5 [Didymosphaeria variabile]KAJ4358542.1 Restriction of telomere capping protein 5 [Didymosphaeria variabile]
MGQGGSAEAPHLSLEQLNHKLAQRFAQKSYTPLELYCFNSVFRSLADTESGVKYWSESTLCRFLELPDSLAVGPILFQMSSYLGAFPFPSQAPAILTYEALLKVVTILTERYGAVIKKRNRELWLRELYRSLAVHDRGLRPDDGDTGQDEKPESQPGGGGSQGFAIDAPEEGGEDDEDDELVLAALDYMDADEVFKHGEHSDVRHSIIPTDNFLKLVELLLLIAPIDAQESLSSFTGELTAERKENLRRTASGILSSFGVSTTQPGITYRTFNTVVSSCLPYLFNGLNPLFEHFLFAKDFDLSKRKPGSSSPTVEKHPVIPAPKPVLDPVLRDPGEILDLTTLSQLSFFLRGSDLFRRLRPLYSGNTHGFSMGSFEKQSFHWRAPTILLVSGRLLPAEPSSTRERAFADSLPPKRYPSSVTPDTSSSDQIITFGAYIPAQWKLTHKGCFGDASTVLFQLSPVHDVFHASSYSEDYVYFNRPPTHPSGLGLGTPVPRQSASSSTHSHAIFRPGPVSLHLDDALEFGVFTHLAEGGGSFHPSRLPVRKSKNWQDRFEIDSLEVWGCGGDEVADAQRKEWAFQEREAEARRRINLGTGDVDADRELLKMAGLVGQGHSGGSV